MDNLYNKAETLKNNKEYNEAIKICKQIINEKDDYNSYVMICNCWYELNDIHKYELWMNRTYDKFKNIEPLYLLTKIFRERGQHFKAYHYYNMSKNIDSSSEYKHKFDYEHTVLHYYVYMNNRIDGLKDTIKFLNRYVLDQSNVYNNMEFYLESIPHETIELNLPEINNSAPSSCSYVEYKDIIIMNTRYVNYRIINNMYYMYENNTFNNMNNLITNNGLCFLDKNFNILLYPIFINNTINLPKKETNIKGIEDIRLFTFQDKIMYIGTTFEYATANTKNTMILGEYDYNNMRLINNMILSPPYESHLEKNWIPINHNNTKILFIYSWYPIKIGHIDENNKLNIDIIHNTPYFFKNIRGSTPIVEYNNMLFAIVHGSIETPVRKYYHLFVILEKDTYKPLKYTVPFYFNKFAVEYTLCFSIMHDIVNIIISRNDNNPCHIKMNIKDINNMFMDC